MVTVKRYLDEDSAIWNEFNASSKNSLFMFDRRYMDYHKDRFYDHSLMFYEDDKLVAILPMCEKGDELVSHGGLTYGGFVVDNNMKQHIMNSCLETLISYAKSNGYKKITYKCVPHIFHLQPSEEDRFALFANGGRLVTVDVSTVVNLSDSLKMSRERKRHISKAKREGVIIEERSELQDYLSFIELQNNVLSQRHGVRAVHTGNELKMLHDNLPGRIHLFIALKDNRIIAGTVIYEYDGVIHTQYMAADDEARTIGALDLTIATVMEKYRDSKKWLDFGISTEHGKIYLNEGLCAQKEGFGGRTNVYEIWELEV